LAGRRGRGLRRAVGAGADSTLETVVVTATRQASPLALVFDTRKSARQTQAGLHWNRRLDADWEAAAVAWAGRRTVKQFQAIPVAAQAPPSSPGGVIDFERNFGPSMRACRDFGRVGR